MTLILSEATQYGIVMITDSAVEESPLASWQLPSKKPGHTLVRLGVPKLVPILGPSFAISYWGQASVGNPTDHAVTIPLDELLRDFATTSSSVETLPSIAQRLANEINPRINVGTTRLGFHVAGFHEDQGKRFPAIYHVHTGGEPPEPQGQLKVSQDIPYGIGKSPQQWHSFLSAGGGHMLRNGAFQSYAVFAEHLNEGIAAFAGMSGRSFSGPSSGKEALRHRARILTFVMRTVCSLYQLADSMPIVAEPLSWITISADGIEECEIIEGTRHRN